MRKTFFDYKLFRDAFNQLKLPGILFTVLATAISILPPFVSIMNYLDSAENVSAHTIDFAELSPYLVFFMFLAPFVLSSNIFGFLNKRKASDFYHSIPNTRSSIFISFSSAVLSWLLIMIVCAVCASALFYTISPADTLSTFFIFGNILFFFVGSLLVFSATVLAMSITGTLLSNFILTGLVMFFPRFIIMLFSFVVNRLTLITTSSDLSFFTNSKVNIPFNTIYGFLFVDADSIIFFELPSLIYTFVVAVIYLAIACLLFNKRKSETAQKSAPNKTLQHIYRCLLTIPLSLAIPVTFLLEKNIDSSTFISACIIALGCLIIYFSYELICTKSFKALLAAAPVLLAIVMFDVIFAFSALLTQQNVLSFQPTAQEIKGVYLFNEDKNQLIKKPSYNQMLLQGLKIEDEQLNEIVSKSLKNTVQAVENDNLQDLYIDCISRKVTVQTKNNKKERRLIFFTAEDSKRLTDIISAQEKYQKAVSSLPTINSETNISFGGETLTKEQKNKLWELYSKEFNALDTSMQALHNYSNTFSSPENLIILNYGLGVNGYYNMKSYYSEFRISNKTPETLLYATNIINSQNGDDFDACINNFFNKENRWAQLYIEHLSARQNNTFSVIDVSLYEGKVEKNDFSMEQAQKIVDIFSRAKENPIDAENLYYINSNIRYVNPQAEEKETLYAGYFITLNQQQQQEIDDIIAEYREDNGITEK
ncbi:MAG: ABC transporter permease [Ruminococcaceae bacterium]|nr:ABC transporter permease [Oscillospiraceae bacterium]